ncbi:hypothetical protein AAVH_27831 [Aphelenchoides avenae]|nr:hypothetical protein AAVH_27831 [Aphelenchus avenae]
MLGLCCSRRNEVQGSAFVQSPYLRWIVGDLRFKRSLPRHDYVQRLVEHFRESSSPESMRRVVFSPDEILCEYTSASYHLPGAYVDFFPCPHCTYKFEEERTSFVEVFHFPNVHNPNVCATVTFDMPADAVRLHKPTACSVEVEFTKGCPNTPIDIEHSHRVVLLTDTDVFIEVLRLLSRSEVEKMQLVSRRWANVIGGSESSLQQRRRFHVFIKFYGESPGMLSVHFAREARLEQWRIPLLGSMPLNSEIRSWGVADRDVGYDNLLTLASCALEPHRKLGCVQGLELGLFKHDATWAQLAGLLTQPVIRAFSEIIVWTTRVAIDIAELRAVLSSWYSRKLHNFVSMRDVNRYVAEFWLRLQKAVNVAFPEMPDVDDSTDRRKRFRHHLQGKDTVVRVSVYENPTARERLTVVTFDHFRRTVFFLNGNVPLAELKQVFQRPYAFY